MPRAWARSPGSWNRWDQTTVTLSFHSFPWAWSRWRAVCQGPIWWKQARVNTHLLLWGAEAYPHPLRRLGRSFLSLRADTFHQHSLTAREKRKMSVFLISNQIPESRAENHTEGKALVSVKIAWRAETRLLNSKPPCQKRVENWISKGKGKFEKFYQNLGKKWWM